MNLKTAFEHEPATESGITELGRTPRSSGDTVSSVEELRLAFEEQDFFDREPVEERASSISLAPPAPLPTPSPERRRFAHSAFALVVCSAVGLLVLATLRLIYDALMSP